jgi:hypothetical protein
VVNGENQPHQQPEGLASGSLDLLTMLLKGAPSDIVKTAYDFCFAAVIRIVLHSEDHGELQVIKYSISSLLHLYIDEGHLSLAF